MKTELSPVFQYLIEPPFTAITASRLSGYVYQLCTAIGFCESFFTSKELKLHQHEWKASEQQLSENHYLKNTYWFKSFQCSSGCMFLSSMWTSASALTFLQPIKGFPPVLPCIWLHRNSHQLWPLLLFVQKNNATQLCVTMGKVLRVMMI